MSHLDRAPAERGSVHDLAERHAVAQRRVAHLPAPLERAGVVWYAIPVLGLGRALVVGVAVVVLAGACNGDDDASPPSTGRVTTTVDPFAVPDPIDAGYVERVMAELDHLYGEAAREVARERALTDEFESIMRAIYADDEEFALAKEIWLNERDEGFAHLAPMPGDPVTQVNELRSASRTCIIAAVRRDLSPVSVGGTSSPRDVFVVLVPSGSTGALRRNVTGWSLAFEGFKADQSPPGEDECAKG